MNTFRYLFCLLIATAAFAATPGWNLTFSDEFNGTSLNTAVWDATYPGGWCTNNDELECYEAENVTVSNGAAHLTAKPQKVTSFGATYSYSSGLIQNSKSFSQQYGYFEIRARVPAGQGLWPAFWMLANNGSWPPEIDVVELIDTMYTSYLTYHYGSTNKTFASQVNGNYAGAYHTWAVDWEPGAITWYIDGVKEYSASNSAVTSLKLYLIANLAVGGSWPGSPNASTVFPAVTDIDYIRAYSKSTSGCYATIPLPSDPIPSTTCGSAAAPNPPGFHRH